MKTSSKAFTLIETLVAITILTVAVAGAFAAVQTGLSASYHSKDEVTAFYFAEEAVEQIRNLRDQNILSGNNWLTGLASNSSDPCYFGKYCLVDALNSGGHFVNYCFDPNSGDYDPTKPCPNLEHDTVNNLYSYHNFYLLYPGDPTWEYTSYERDVSLKSINDHEIAVLVSIRWSRSGVEQTFNVRENLLNWQ